MKNYFISRKSISKRLMCSSLLDFPVGVLTVVGEETVLAVLHQHGEFDSDHLIKRAHHLFFSNGAAVAGMS